MERKKQIAEGYIKSVNNTILIYGHNIVKEWETRTGILSGWKLSGGVGYTGASIKITVFYLLS